MRRHALVPIALAAALLLGGCDLVGGALGIESPEKVAAARDADGRAIGGACRHAGRAIEDCYALNKKADRAAIFAGWRDMNDYMRENKIDTVAPALGPAAPLASNGARAARDDDDAKAPAAVEKPPAKAASGKSADAAKPHARDAAKAADA